ncbi:DUF664 domain-containing protein [Phytoactinopolyspora alkaliphila]|uniref:DUF664 domain-containing protein n=1 Tax=Phytoactinopolyspora alkaliphila TaxID=1783498 RepID=A0A6N9YK40_9ACTN|nr:DUF664 domain-containing protein [Phytoactinopolyspora alkaliphila]NED95305.1 DUF664 domain-containing protein [Phytoactinopolyspora alkaliphila]
MDVAGLLIDAFERIQQGVHRSVEGLEPMELTHRVDRDANTIAWLVWHLTRVEDDHLSEVADRPQVWTEDRWADRFGLPFPADATGYGHGSGDVAAVEVTADLLLGYHDAVHAMTTRYLSGLSETDLDRIVDERWDPPVTLGVRLISVVNDATQHVGQAGFVRGIVERVRSTA